MVEIPHVVVLGAGFGGIGVVQKLRDAPVQITIVDKHDFHTFQPLLYQVATDELSPAEVGHPIRDLLHRHTNVAFHNCPVLGIDLAKSQVRLDGMEPLQYDYLAIALGAVVNFHNTPGAAEHSFPLYSMPDAVRLHDHILRMFEAVDKNPALADDGALNFCIVGGGATGTELAGALSELIHADMVEDYPNLPVGKAQVMLFEHSPHLLSSFVPKLQDYARAALTDRGVIVHTNTGVQEVAPAEIKLTSGQTIKTHTLVWAAGVRANPLTQSLGIPLGPGGRIPVDPTLQLKDHPNVFALGDNAAMTDIKSGKPLPGLGAVALQAGRYVGETIKLLPENQPVKPFRYFNKGTMAQIGRGAGVVELPGGSSLTGPLAWMAWLGVHLSLLSGTEDKTSVFVDWGWNAITRKRANRTLLSNDERTDPPPQTPAES